MGACVCPLVGQPMARSLGLTWRRLTFKFKMSSRALKQPLGP